MPDYAELMSKIGEQIGDRECMDGLLVKSAVIKNDVGSRPEDILGWNYILHAKDNLCWSVYIAQWSIGMSTPQLIKCPLGVRIFDHYNVDFKQAIAEMQKLDCGSDFTAMSLSWPLTPECKQPYWHIRTTIGNTIVIPADSGPANCH